MSPSTPPPAADVFWARRQSLWTCPDIARELAIADRTVRRWCDDGLLVSFRTPGGHHRVRAEDLEAFLNGPSATIANDARPLPAASRAA